jgi:ribosomal protein S27AE
MASMSRERRIGADRPGTQAIAASAQQELRCGRCGGLMVSGDCIDLLSSRGQPEFAAKRCVQCGEVIDPVIRHNRQLRQDQQSVV